jgi:CheY-like chemotaxis protein
MSHGSIFRFTIAASAANSVSASAFHHAAIDADASARLAAMDRAFAEEDDPVDAEQIEGERSEAGHAENEQVKEVSVEATALNADATTPESGAPESQDDANDFPPEQLVQAVQQASQQEIHQPVQDEVQQEAQLESLPELQLDTQSQAEEELLAALVAVPVAARANSRVIATTPCEDEADVTDPLAILSQTIAGSESSEPTNMATEVELAQIDQADQIELTQSAAVTEDLPAEVAGIFAAAEAAGEIIHHHGATREPAAEEISLIETTIVETDLAADAEPSAPIPLEVAPILNASGELQPGADDYTPPAPFEIHVPEALTVAEAPVSELPAATDVTITEVTTSGMTAKISDSDLTETFDLNSLCAPTEAEQINDKAIAQQQAVAEMNAAAEEFVAGQIASEECAESETASHAAAPCAAQNETATSAASPLETAAAALNAEAASDRRRKRRAVISAPIRVRSIHVTTSGPDEISTTVDVSRYGILFHTILDTYQRGMDVAVVFPYHKSATGAHAEQFGRVVRLHDLPDGRHAVAIALGVGIGEHLVDASGRKLTNERVQLSYSVAPQVKRPLVLAVDSDDMLRDTMKLYLQNEGYEVIAVSNIVDAREVLNMFTPAVIVAEIEGEGDILPGLDLCAHVKSSPSLKHIPVVLTSRSGYPSDYSNAHSMGAVVCMAKPYKQERLGHIVRLLAPLPEHLQPACTQRPPDPTRGFGRDSNVTQRQNGAKKSNGAAKSRFKFPSFR